MKVSVVVLALILASTMLMGCNDDSISGVSSANEEIVTLSEREDSALADSMSAYLYENLSEECLSMIDNDGFGFFVGHFDGGWDISMCVKERAQVIPATKELYETLRKRAGSGELSLSEISVKYYNKDDHDNTMLIFKLTDGDGNGTLTDRAQPDEQQVREDVPYDEINLYVNEADGTPIDVPVETKEGQPQVIIIYK